jgi:hypothetical protein
MEVYVVVAVQLDFQGATLEQYDEMNERIGLLPGGPTAAPEDLFHWVTKTEDGDNGCGFSITDQARRRRGGHVGTRGLEELAAERAATLTIDSQPGRGTRLKLIIPMSA